MDIINAFVKYSPHTKVHCKALRTLLAGTLSSFAYRVHIPTYIQTVEHRFFFTYVGTIVISPYYHHSPCGIYNFNYNHVQKVLGILVQIKATISHNIHIFTYLQ